jgi:hypothetical protein
MKTKDETLLREAIELLNEAKSIQFAQKFCVDLLEGAWKELEPVIKRDELKEELKAMCTFLIDRAI